MPSLCSVSMASTVAAWASICVASECDLFRGGGLLDIELGHPTGKNNAEARAKFFAECTVTLRLRGLALERVHLTRNFFEDVVDAGEVEAGGFEAKFGEAFFGLEAGDAGGFFEDGAAIQRFGAEELADALLADDGVGFATETSPHEDVLNIAEPADFAVEEVFAVAGPEEAAGDGELAGADGSAAEFAAADFEDDVVWVGELGCGVSFCCGWDDVGALGFAFDDGAGLGFGDGLFGLLGALLAEAGFVPVGGEVVVDDDLGVASRPAPS